MKQLGDMKRRLKELQFVRPFEMDIKNIELALHGKDYSMLLTRYTDSILNNQRVGRCVLCQSCSGT